MPGKPMASLRWAGLMRRLTIRPAPQIFTEA
jgi:hypothetical protein